MAEITGHDRQEIRKLINKHESMMQAYRILLPYCFQQDEDDKLLLTAFNRDYEEIPRAVIRFKRNPAAFKGVWFEISDTLSPGGFVSQSFYMYNDNPESREDYWKRLGRLYSHRHIVSTPEQLEIFCNYVSETPPLGS